MPAVIAIEEQYETSFAPDDPFAPDGACYSIRSREPGCDEFAGDESPCEVEIDENFTAYLGRALDAAQDAAALAEERLRRLGSGRGVGVADPDAVMRLAGARDAVGDLRDAVEAIVWQGGGGGDFPVRHDDVALRLYECNRRLERCEAKYAATGVIA